MPATYEPIATTTLGSNTDIVSFTSISGSYTDIRAIITNTITTAFSVTVRLNNDSGSNYSYSAMVGDGSTATSSRASSQTELQINAGDTATINLLIVDFMNYSNTTTNKSVISRASVPSDRISLFSGLWRSTSAINRIDFRAQPGGYAFISGSTFTLYGIKAA